MDWFVSVENMYKSGLYTSYVEIFPFLPTDNLSQQQIINTVLYQVQCLKMGLTNNKKKRYLLHFELKVEPIW